MQFRKVDAADLRTLADMAEPLQRRPDRHVVYLDTNAEPMVHELEESTYEIASAVAEDNDGRVAGWLIGDVDEEMARVWWFGPFVAADEWQPLATDLLTECRDQLPANVCEEEMAVDDRFDSFRPWAESMGFEALGVGSWVVTLDGDIGDASIAVRPARPDDAVLVELHERLFPGTHTTGRQLIASADDTHLRLVTEIDGELAGYVAVELQPSGEGYVDYLGVAEQHRRRGLGRELVRAGVAAVRGIGAGSINLTVREDNDGARDLYESLGFTAERLARPFRMGFSIG